MNEDRRSIWRLLVPVLLILGGIGIGLMVFSNTLTAPSTKSPPPPAPTVSRSAPPSPQSDDSSSSSVSRGVPPRPDDSLSSQTADEPPAPVDTQLPQPAAPVPSAPPGLHARVVGPAPSPDAWPTLGSLTTKDNGGTFELAVRFTPHGAGLAEVALANEFEHLGNAADHEIVQRYYARPDAPGLGLAPMALTGVVLNGARVDLWGQLDPATLDLIGSYWEHTGSRSDTAATFTATIVDAADTPIAKVVRTYSLQPGSYEVVLHQHVENLTDAPMSVVWEQFGPVELPVGTIRYGGDIRRVRFGYLLDQTRFPPDVQASEFQTSHRSALGKATGVLPSGLPRWDSSALWPNPTSTKNSYDLVWTGMTSRYFGAMLHGVTDANLAAQPVNQAIGAAPWRKFCEIESVGRVAIATPPALLAANNRAPNGRIALTLRSVQQTAPPGKSASAPMALYAGPLSKDVLTHDPLASAAGLDRVVIYNFGGPCALCTFQPIARGLRGFLGFLHDHIFYDWAIAIMFLVVCVRTVLHPVTKWSQKSLYRFGKDMQRLAPKQKKLQEKYKNDPLKLREEQARLMKEEGVNYAGMLGCLPMFLQTPVWMALAPMLFFTYELRHEGAFFGVFQKLSGGSWHFLADLAEPDHFIPFGRSIHVPILSGFMGSIDGINLLPLMLGIVFFIQQKYLQPPTTAELTPEQKQQQKIMKVFSVIMFPVFAYNAPAGLSLYFIMNSTLAIFESRHIRHQAEREDQERAKLPPEQRKAKPKGWFGKRLEEAQKRALEFQQMREQAEKRRAGPKR